ncbi:MAG: SUF system NifU family Fe-S cluster assembly protein [Catonella sp.]|jgi:nitrogen fixation NifU-like protein|nr:SUF system NifU family Fe-S cluster assembly protein [Catonella sp.]MDY6357800.1 SUF system NifU family Fe-S cluster assembly protein [Catonella sp.]
MELKSIYNDLVNDHNMHPNNKHTIENPTLTLRGVNPTCGDDITLQLKIEDGVVTDGGFTGNGCAISQASTDMLLDDIIGRKKEDAEHLCKVFLGMIKGDEKDDAVLSELDDAIALRDISHMPARVKCAVLAWHTADEMLAETSRQL